MLSFLSKLLKGHHLALGLQTNKTSLLIFKLSQILTKIFSPILKMTYLPDDLDFYGRLGVYRGYRREEPYLDKRSLRRQRKSLRYEQIYPKLIEWAIEDCIMMTSQVLHGEVGFKIMEICQNALLERSKDMKNQTRVVELSYYVRAVKRANPTRTIRDARKFYRAQRYFCYKVIETIESLAMVRFRELSYIHPVDRFEIDHPVYTLDPAFEEAVEILKVLYALEN